MESELCHEVILTNTRFRILFQQNDQRGGGVNTHVDSADPFRFLVGTECSPFPPYRWFCTGGRIIRTRYAYCVPQNGKGEREKFVGKHDSLGEILHKQTLLSIYCFDSGAALQQVQKASSK